MCQAARTVSRKELTLNCTTHIDEYSKGGDRHPQTATLCRTQYKVVQIKFFIFYFNLIYLYTVIGQTYSRNVERTCNVHFIIDILAKSPGKKKPRHFSQGPHSLSI